MTSQTQIPFVPDFPSLELGQTRSRPQTASSADTMLINSAKGFKGSNCDENDPLTTCYRRVVMESADNLSRISRYLRALSCHSFLDSVNETLSVRSGAFATELLGYYRSHPDLRQLTVKADLARMEYALYLPSGDAVFDKAEIALHAHAHTQEEAHELSWRAANQSIFAHAIDKLISNSDTGLIRPSLHASAVATRCGFLVNMAERTLSAQCDLTISVPSMEHEGKLEIATVALAVNLIPCEGRVDMHCTNLVPLPLTEAQIISAELYAASHTPIDEPTQHDTDITQIVGRLNSVLQERMDVVKRLYEAAVDEVKVCLRQLQIDLKEEMDAVRRLHKLGFFTSCDSTLFSRVSIRGGRDHDTGPKLCVDGDQLLPFRKDNEGPEHASASARKEALYGSNTNANSSSADSAEDSADGVRLADTNAEDKSKEDTSFVEQEEGADACRASENKMSDEVECGVIVQCELTNGTVEEQIVVLQQEKQPSHMLVDFEFDSLDAHEGTEVGSLEGGWDVVDSVETNERQALARAAEAIGSSLFQEDISRSAESLKSPPISRSSSLSMVSSVSSVTSSLSYEDVDHIARSHTSNVADAADCDVSSGATSMASLSSSATVISLVSSMGSSFPTSFSNFSNESEEPRVLELDENTHGLNRIDSVRVGTNAIDLDASADEWSVVDSSTEPHDSQHVAREGETLGRSGSMASSFSDFAARSPPSISRSSSFSVVPSVSSVASSVSSVIDSVESTSSEVQISAECLYGDVMASLREMGFTDDRRSEDVIEALRACEEVVTVGTVVEYLVNA